MLKIFVYFICICLFGAANGVSVPDVVQQFNSSVQLVVNGSPKIGRLLYDSINQLSLLSLTKPLYDEEIHETELLNSTSGFFMIQGQCYVANGHFYDRFSWMDSDLTIYTGNKTYNDRECEEFSLSIQSITLVACVTPNGIPIYYSLNEPGLSEEIIFGDDLITGPIDPTKFSFPTPCLPPTECEENNEIVEIDAYIFHPANKFAIWDQNVADALGDCGFVCFDVISNNTANDNYQWISWYKLEVWTRWGQYQFCNGYPPVCIGENNYYVGREASFGLGDMGGQCSINNITGSWYSLPSDGMCNQTDQVIGQNCSWKIIERVKTINGSCLTETQGMIDVCLQEVSMPLLETNQIFLQAFNSDDIENGGCPNIVNEISLEKPKSLNGLRSKKIMNQPL